jgi:hypothetical protein
MDPGPQAIGSVRDMTDWAAVLADGRALPDEELGSVLDELVEALASPDPVLRDERAYRVLVTWIGRGDLDGRLAQLGDRAAAMLRHPEIQARTFAALVLAAAVNRDTAAGAAAGVLDAATVRRWREAFAGWYAAEADLRGWDERLGWLHAVAHGADALDEFGVSPRLERADLLGLLELAAGRLTTPTGYLFAHQEDDRLAYALTRLLARPELAEADAVGWLDGIRRFLEAGTPGPVPAEASNTLRTLRCLYVMVDRGVHAGTVLRPPHRAPILAALGDTLAIAFPGQA